MNIVTEAISSVSLDGDTWTETERLCPDCSRRLASNGSDLVCAACGYHARVVDVYKRKPRKARVYVERIQDEW